VVEGLGGWGNGGEGGRGIRRDKRGGEESKGVDGGK
jgi:hypothetical protein